jgi:hypothetical protein
VRPPARPAAHPMRTMRAARRGLNLFAHLTVVSAYPVVSIAAVALDVAVIAALVAFWRR